MVYHFLNGDCLAEQLKSTAFKEHQIIFRECLVEGDVKENVLPKFWEKRAEFIASAYDATTEAYFDKTVKEFEKIYQIKDGSEVCLWFENDLFCQVNLWFLITQLAKNTTLKLYRVFPIVEQTDDEWSGFAYADAQLLTKAYHEKVELNPADISLAKNLWLAYSENNLEALITLSKQNTPAFKYLEKVCQAHAERFPGNNSLSRPMRTVKEIIDGGVTDFESVFKIFSKREGIYGFGDLQVKKIYDRYFGNGGSQ